MNDLVMLLPRVPDEHAVRLLAIRCALFSATATRRQLEVALRHVDVIRPHVPAGFDLATIEDALRARLEIAPAEIARQPRVGEQLDLFGRAA